MTDRATGRAAGWLTIAFAVLLGSPGAAHDPPRTTVTWHGDIARLVQSRCTRCHSPEGKGPMSLMTYEDARPWARAMREEVLARRMPKWHAARGYGEFANDPTLSPFDIALIVAWVDGGAVRGDPSKAPPQSRAGQAAGAASREGRNDRPRMRRPPAAGGTAARHHANARRRRIRWVQRPPPRRPSGDRRLDPGLRSGVRGYLLAGVTDRPSRGSRLRVEAGAGCRVELKIGAPLHEGHAERFVLIPGR